MLKIFLAFLFDFLDFFNLGILREQRMFISEATSNASCNNFSGRGPACVEELYRRASSKDKTLTIYPGMWHQLVGEPEENVEQVFNDILHWLRSRAEQAAAAAPNNLEPPNANGTPTQQEAAA